MSGLVSVIVTKEQGPVIESRFEENHRKSPVSGRRRFFWVPRLLAAAPEAHIRDSI